MSKSPNGEEQSRKDELDSSNQDKVNPPSDAAVLAVIWEELLPGLKKDGQSERPSSLLDKLDAAQRDNLTKGFRTLLDINRPSPAAGGLPLEQPAVGLEAATGAVPRFVPPAPEFLQFEPVLPASKAFVSTNTDGDGPPAGEKPEEPVKGPAVAGDKPAEKPEIKPPEIKGVMDDPVAKRALLETVEQLGSQINPGGRAFDLNRVREELARNEFGPETRKAFTQAAIHLEGKASIMLRLLDARGLEIPVDCPLEPPIDPRSGRHVLPEWFQAALMTGKISLKLQLNANETANPADVQRLRRAADWLIRAEVQFEHANVEAKSDIVKGQIQALNPNGKLDRWLPRADFTDVEREHWVFAALPWVNKTYEVRNYAHAIAALYVATKDNAKPDNIFGLKVPKLTTLPSSIFSDAALQDENFPGHVERNPDGTIKDIEFTLPSGLERTPENEEKIKGLERWLQKYAPDVDQVLQAVSLAAIEQGRTLMWGDIPVEGTIRPNGFEVTIVEKRSDNRGGTVDAVIHKEQFESEQKANEFAEEYKKGAKFKPGQEVRVLPGEVITVDEHPVGSFFDKRTLAPGEQKFNLREFRFTASQVQTADGPMIAVTSTQKFQYAPGWSVYNVYARDVKTQVLGTAEKPVYYKPDDFVVVYENGRSQLIQAKYLPRMATENSIGHYGSKGANMLMDAGFLLMGAYEMKAAWSLAARAGTAAGAKAAFMTCLKDTIASRGSWHFMLGVTGIAGHPIEHGFGDAGKNFNHARNMAMLGDIALRSTFLGTWAKSIWGAAAPAGAVEYASAFKKICDASTYYKGLTTGMKVPEYFMLTELLGRTVPDLIERTRPDTKDQTVANTRAYRGAAFMPSGETLDRLGAIQREVEGVKRLPDTDNSKSAKLDELAVKYAKSFRDASSEDEKFISALALLAVRAKKDQPVPDELATVKSGNAEHKVTKGDVERFLQQFQLSQTRKQIEEYASKTDLKNPEINFEKISEVLMLPEDHPTRKQYVQKLLVAVQEVRQLERRVDEIAATLKRYRDSSIQLNPGGDSEGFWSRHIKSLEVAHKEAQVALDAKDKSDAVVAAMGLSVLGVNKENGQLNRELARGTVYTVAATVAVPDGNGGFVTKVLDQRSCSTESEANALRAALTDSFSSNSPKPNVSVRKAEIAYTAADFLHTLDRSIAKLPSGPLRTAASDMLLRMGERDVWQHTSVLKATLEDPKGSRLAKADALLGSNSVGVGELMELMRFGLEKQIQSIGDVTERGKAMAHTFDRDSKAMQDCLLRIIRDQNEGPDVRAMAARVLMANSAATAADRKASLDACRRDWERLKDEPGQFSREFIESLKKDITASVVGLDDVARQTVLEKSFRAAIALADISGPPTIGIDAATKTNVTAALVACFDYEHPAVALQALKHLIPGRLNELTPEQLERLRSTGVVMLGPGTELSLIEDQKKEVSLAQERLKIAEASKDAAQVQIETEKLKKELASLSTLESNSAARVPLRKELITRLSPLMGNGGTSDQYREVLASLRDTMLRGEGPSFFYAGGEPELREVAARTYADLVNRHKLELDEAISKATPEKSADLERVRKRLLDDAAETFRRVLGFGTNKNERDTSPRVRLAAIDGLGIVDAPDLHGIVMKLMVTETDPAVLKKLAGIEYNVRRMDENSAEYKEIYDRIKTSLERRASEIPLADGKAMCDEFRERYKNGARQWWQELVDVAKGDGAEAKRARGALMYLFYENDGVFAELWLRDELLEIMQKKGPEVRKELTGHILAALISVPKMPTSTRYGLVEMLNELKPGTPDSPVSRDEAAVVLLTVLQNQLRYGTKGDINLRFQTSVLRELQKYPSEKVLPALDAIVAAEIIQQRDAWQRPLKVRYPDGTGFDFVYKEDGYSRFLNGFTEIPGGEKWEPDPDQNGIWKSNKGNTRNVRWAGADIHSATEGGLTIVSTMPDGVVDEHYFPNGRYERTVRRKVTVIREGMKDDTVHPDQQVTRLTRDLISDIRNGTGLIQTKALEELTAIDARVKSEKDYKPDFGATVPPDKLAEQIRRKVGDINNDAVSTCRTIFLAGLRPPIQNENDPRRAVLMEALKDGHEMVRLAAAKVLFLNSDLKTDRATAAAVIADIGKNGCRPGFQKDALDFAGTTRSVDKQKDFRPGDRELMLFALEQTKPMPREEKPTRSKPSPVDEASIAYQKAFEKMKVQIAIDSRELLEMDMREWNALVEAKGLNLLNPIACGNACSAAAKNRWADHKWEWRTSGWEYIRAEEKKVTDHVKAQAKAQFEQFIGLVKEGGDGTVDGKVDPDAKRARMLLLHIVLSNGSSLSNDLTAEAVPRAAQTIVDICKSNGAGRGELVNGIQMCLTDCPMMPREIRMKLVEAYVALIEPDGPVRRETAAAVLSLALNAEYKSTPPAGAAGYEESVNFQRELLEKVIENANREMLPVLKGWANFHQSKEVRDRAQAFHDLLKRGPVVKANGGKVSEVEYVTGKKRAFAYEGEVLTQVTDIDGRVWKRIKNPGAAGYTDSWSCGDQNDIRKDLVVDSDGTFHFTQGSTRRSVRPVYTRSKKLV